MNYLDELLKTKHRKTKHRKTKPMRTSLYIDKTVYKKFSKMIKGHRNAKSISATIECFMADVAA